MEHSRLAVVGLRIRYVRHRHVFRQDGRSCLHRLDGAAAAQRELGRIHGIEPAQVQRILAHHAHGLRTALADSLVGVLLQPKIPFGARHLDEASELVPADMVERLGRGAVRVDLPRQEYLHVVSAEAVRGIVDLAAIRKDRLDDVVGPVEVFLRRIGLFAEIVEGVRAFEVVLVQVIPVGEDHTAESVDDRREGTARRRVQQRHLARAIELEDAAGARLPLVLVQMLQMTEFRIGAARGDVRGEDDELGAAVALGRIDGRNVVVLARLRQLRELDRLALVQAAHFIDLPASTAGAADHHADQRGLRVKTHRGLADRNHVGTALIGVRRSILHAEPGFLSQVAQLESTIGCRRRIGDHEIAAARRFLLVRQVVAEGGKNLRERLAGCGRLRHEEDRLALAAGSRCYRAAAWRWTTAAGRWRWSTSATGRWIATTARRRVVDLRVAAAATATSGECQHHCDDAGPITFRNSH